MKTKLMIWNRDDVTLLDIEKMRARKCEFSAQDNAAEFANLAMNHIPSNTLDLVFDNIASEIKRDRCGGMRGSKVYPYARLDALVKGVLHSLHLCD